MMLKLLLLITLCGGLLCGGHGGGYSAWAKMQPPLPTIKPDIIGQKSQAPVGFLKKIGSLFSKKGPPLPKEKPVFKKQASTKPKTKRTIPSQFLKARSLQKSISNHDAALYKKIFAAQKKGEMQEADQLLKKISNPLLLGHVLYQRYMHPSAYHSDYKELKDWLAHYADHPNADKIYTLAQRKIPNEHKGELEPPHTFKGLPRVGEPTMRPEKHYSSSKQRSEIERNKIKAIRKAIRSLIRQGKEDEALSLIGSEETARNFDIIELDLLKANMAAALLYQGDINSAYYLATQAVSRSALYVPKAGWIVGLVSWKRQDYTQAARYFETAARSSYASGWLLTAASYWAARAHMRSGNVKFVSTWLERGVTYPRTFYGLISTRALGHNFEFNWTIPSFTKAMSALLIKNPAGARALALTQAGELEKAQTELLRIKPSNTEEQKAFLAFAHDKGLPKLSMRLAGTIARPEKGQYYDAALYPEIPWQTAGGYTVNKALLHAIIKQESRFDPHAKSFSGATGLMQIMPATAKWIAGDKANQLEDPHTSLEVGQLYLNHLLSLSAVENNLLYLLIAYNAGPGNLIKWKKRWPDVHDPLLFIELIPSSETRAYIERVLANYWIYRMRERKNTQTLDLVASGKAPLYKP